MRHINFLSLAVLAISNASPAEAQLVGTRVTQSGPMLPANTLVYVSLNSDLSSKRTNVGDTFDVTVTRPVISGDYIVVPQGTLGHGRITWRTGKAVFGKSAKMYFDLTDLQIGNQTVPLTGRYRLQGNGNTGWTVGSVVAVGLVGGLFVTGHSATAMQGTEYKAFTAAPAMFAIAEPGTPAFFANGGSVPISLGRNASESPFENGRRIAEAQMAAAGTSN